MRIKRICALTMCRNDEFYLRKWVEYYGSQLGKENLYIFFDGKDQVVPSFCEGTNVELVDKIPGKVVAFDRNRLNFLSDKAERLFKRYNLVIGTDTDEYLIVDPSLGKSLKEFLSALEIDTSVSGLGVDVGQKLGEEGDIREDMPFLQQRQYARLSTRYTKPSVIARPVRWGSGFHRIKGHNYHIVKNLYLFHTGYFDMKRIESRFSDTTRFENAAQKHIKKRSKNIKLVSTRKAWKWEWMTAIARVMETIFRPPYAINKPSLLELALIVRIPERFRNII